MYWVLHFNLGSLQSKKGNLLFFEIFRNYTALPVYLAFTSLIYFILIILIMCHIHVSEEMKTFFVTSAQLRYVEKFVYFLNEFL
jgi:hypothetical protein